MTSTGTLVKQAPSQIEDPKVILLPWMIGTMADNLLQGGYPFSSSNLVSGTKSLTKPYNQA